MCLPLAQIALKKIHSLCALNYFLIKCVRALEVFRNKIFPLDRSPQKSQSTVIMKKHKQTKTNKQTNKQTQGRTLIKLLGKGLQEGRKEMFYLTTHSTHLGGGGCTTFL